jgi:hypothetical protein
MPSAPDIVVMGSDTTRMVLVVEAKLTSHK